MLIDTSVTENRVNAEQVGTVSGSGVLVSAAAGGLELAAVDAHLADSQLSSNAVSADVGSAMNVASRADAGALQVSYSPEEIRSHCFDAHWMATR